MKKKIQKYFLLLIPTVIIYLVFCVFLNTGYFITAQQKNDIKVTSITNENLIADDASFEIRESTENNEEAVAAEAENSQENQQTIPDETEEINKSALPIYIPIKRSSNEITIGFITDLHVESFTKPFISRINYFVEKMNNETVPDFILIGGDIVEGTKLTTKTTSKNLSLVKGLFDQSNIPKYWVPGNHDFRSYSKHRWKEILAINYLRKSFYVRDYKIIILDSNFTEKEKDVSPGNGYTRGHVSREEIQWLEKELKNTNKKTVVFIHHAPLRDVDFKSNFELLDNAERLREVFSKYNVLAVFGGHLEELYNEKNGGVKYFSLPGAGKNATYPGAFCIIKIKDKNINVELNYLSGNSYKKIIL